VRERAEVEVEVQGLMPTDPIVYWKNLLTRRTETLRLRAERAEAEVERLRLLLIEARNPGIDMDEVRRALLPFESFEPPYPPRE
jgi:hypothetical protein